MTDPLNPFATLPGIPGYTGPTKNPDPFLNLDRVIPSRKFTLDITGIALTVFALPAGVVEDLLDQLADPETLALLNKDADGKLDMSAIARKAFSLVDILVPAALNTDWTAAQNARRLPIQDGLQLMTEIVLASFPGGMEDFLSYSKRHLAELGIVFTVKPDESTTTDQTTAASPTASTTTTPTADSGVPAGIDPDAPIPVSTIPSAAS